MGAAGAVVAAGVDLVVQDGVAVVCAAKCTFALGVQVGAGATGVVSVDAADDVSAGWAASTGAEVVWIGAAVSMGCSTAVEEEVWAGSAGSAVSVGCSAAVEEEELLESSSPVRADSRPLVMVPMVDSIHSVTSPAQPRTRLAMSEA